MLYAYECLWNFFYFKHTNIIFKRIVEQFKKLKQSPFMN